MVFKRGAGPSPIPYKELSAQGLSLAILEALKPAVKASAEQISSEISRESGAETAAMSFLAELPVDDFRCRLLPLRSGVWKVKKSSMVLSCLAVAILGDAQLLTIDEVEL